MKTPTTIKKGSPTDEYPCKWAIYDWIEGTADLEGEIADSEAAVIALGTFLRTLRDLEATKGPAPGFHNFDRGVELMDAQMMKRKEHLEER